MDLDAIRAIRDAISKPLNVHARPHLSFAELVDAGAQRVSVGGALAWVAAQAVAAAATEIRERGDFSSLPAKPPPLDEWLGA